MTQSENKISGQITIYSAQDVLERLGIASAREIVSTILATFKNCTDYKPEQLESSWLPIVRLPGNIPHIKVVTELYDNSQITNDARAANLATFIIDDLEKPSLRAAREKIEKSTAPVIFGVQVRAPEIIVYYRSDDRRRDKRDS